MSDEIDLAAIGAVLGSEFLRERLAQVRAKTEGAAGIEPPGYWEGDRAGERRVLDDGRAGRLEFLAARANAEHGLEALEQGDLELATACWRQAETLYTAALEAAIPPKNRAALAKGAGQRGRRPSTKARNQRLAEAVDRQIENGLKPKAARAAALKADATLAEAFAGCADSALEKAYREGKIPGIK